MHDDDVAQGDDAAHQARVAVFAEIYFRTGWVRYLPHAALTIMRGLVLLGPLRRDQLNELLVELRGHGEEGPAWEELPQWTDEELQAERVRFAGTPLAADAEVPAQAAAVMAEEAQGRAERIAESDAHSRHLGVPVVRTVGHTLDFMLAAGVLVERRGPTGAVIAMNADAPLPSEVLPLSDADRAEEDALRWHQLHEPTAQRIIRTFDPDGARVAQRTISLQQLARELDVDAESARAAVLVLISEGDFDASLDAERTDTRQVFQLAVDWNAFDTYRLGSHADS